MGAPSVAVPITTHGRSPISRTSYPVFVSPRFSKAALIALGYEEVALDDFWQTFLQELDALPNMEMGQLEVCACRETGLPKM